MRVITGYMPPTEGTRDRGRASTSSISRIEAKRRIGYLPETPPLYPDMTVREYLDVRRAHQGRARRASARPASRRPWSAPGSPTWRTGTAASSRRATASASASPRRMLHNPDVLVLDEPTAGLDPKQIIETRELIQELAGDHTIILSTHILPEVAQTCQRVVIINKGRVVAVDTPDNLTRRLARRGDDVRAGRRRRRDAAVAAGRGRASPACAVADRHGARPWATRWRARAAATSGATWRARWWRRAWGLLELRPLRMSLEEIFLQVTTEEAAGRAEPAEEATA
ncbi:MAG: ABC transporter ATP-binding protein [Sphingobacterium sp.]|nr:ABC transporter ATP-binding protein [Sphingobacterium sp.]